MRIARTLCGAVAVVAMLLPSGARADEWNKLTYLTFSGPVQLPGITLPAATYTFRIPEGAGNRHVVQIFNKDQSKLFTTLLSIPDRRLQPADKPVVLFAESPAGTPKAVKAWFYPGDLYGEEFVYPKREAVQIAKANHAAVLAADDDFGKDSSAMQSAKVGRVDENGNMSDADADAQAAHDQHASAQGTTGTTAGSAGTAASPAPASGSTARSAGDRDAAAQGGRPAVGTSGRAHQGPAKNDDAATGSTSRNTRRHLPRTASPLALYELVAGISLAGGAALRAFRRSRA